jgi:D-alanyl-D-alanine carboxypeptidase
MGHHGKFSLAAFVTTPLVACLCMLVSLAPARAQVGSIRYSAIVMDATNGRVIMGANQDAPRYPASLTKLMTLYMTFEALRDRRIQFNQFVPVSAWASAQPPSKLGLQPGDSLTVEQAILALVTKSANDAAAALGEFLGGSEDRFAQMMTLRARALGMSRTNFRNASGLPDPNQYTTAHDLAILARRLVIDFPQLYGFFSVQGFAWHNRVIPNHDSMLRSYPGADGMKTGYTDLAGHNLVTSAVRGNVRLIGVVMGTGSNWERDQHMSALLDAGFARDGGGGEIVPHRGFGNPFISTASASTVYSPRPTGRQTERSVLAERMPRDYAIQTGAVASERAAYDLAQEAGRMAPRGQPRVQPVVVGRHTKYHAQLFDLSEPEARMVCANLGRQAPACQVFRMTGGQTASR